MMTSIAEAVKILGVSRSTAYRMRKGGTLNAAVAKAQRCCNKLLHHPAPGNNLLPRPLSAIEQRQLDDLQFAEAYASGNETDSMGNTVTGNTRWPGHGKVSALGPMAPQPKPRRQHGDSHMPAGLQKPINVPHNAIDSDAVTELWHPGHGERMEQMYRRSGQRKPSEGERKTANDVSIIAASFRQGWSR